MYNTTSSIKQMTSFQNKYVKRKLTPHDLDNPSSACFVAV